MANIYVFSDPHFHHRNMAIRRGFKDEIEMNEYIIKMYNSVINKKDTCYILGDITMEKSRDYYKEIIADLSSKRYSLSSTKCLLRTIGKL